MTKKHVSKKAEDQQQCIDPQGVLLAIGGKEDKGGDLSKVQRQNKEFIHHEILQRFVDELKGSNPLIVVVPTASTEPEEAAKDYESIFADLGVNNLELMQVACRQDTRDPAFAGMVERAAGIMFTGGDQLRLTAILGGTPLLQLMKERYTYEPVVIAGTSAGAMAMSTPMIYGGSAESGYLMGDVAITTGLEFLKDVAIDTHFIARGRIVRMAQAISMNPTCVGLGLEEDTAVLVRNGKDLEVLGSGIVTVLDGMGLSDTSVYEVKKEEPFSARDFKLHLLSRGQTYQLPTFPQLHC
ncbi:MAG: cyanophycinase [Adhaeribacter sp.]